MKAKARERFRSQLLALGREVAGEVTTHRDEGFALGTDGIQDPGDEAANTYTRQLLLGLSERERDVLRQIDGALDRLDDGTYGVCEACGEEIGEARLSVLPYATLCVECKSNQEIGAR